MAGVGVHGHYTPLEFDALLILGLVQDTLSYACCLQLDYNFAN